MPKDTQVSRSEVGTPRSNTVCKKMKDDEEDEEHPGPGWSEEDLKFTYHRKELRDFVDQDSVMRILKLKRFSDPKDPVTAPVTLANKLDATMELIRLVKEAGMIPGSFDADALFDMDLDVIQATSRDLFQKLKNPSRRGTPEPRFTATNHERCGRQLDSVVTLCATVTESSDRSVGTLQKFFNAAMDRYLAEERGANKDPASTRPQHQGSQDVEMESIRSSHRWEYDPDDVDWPTSAQATVFTAATGATGSTMIQRVRISAISDLKEFTGKDQDEDRARAWISKVKSAFMRDQASDDEKCLTFADHLAGSAKNWYRQLSRSTRNKWSELLRSFQTQYCGLGVSQGNTTLRRSDESPLDYLYRLNVAGLRVRLKIKDGNAKERREHVDHYIETLEDQDLAERLTLLRLTDADDLEEVLRARDPAKNRQKKAAFGSSKYRQKPTNSTPSAPAKQIRAIQIQAVDPGSDSESDGS
ncbi:LOW QUALITY PROTEIN: hypothetical protein PHMEG_00037241, partial [Phytophthora megakarya]